MIKKRHFERNDWHIRSTHLITEDTTMNKTIIHPLHRLVQVAVRKIHQLTLICQYERSEVQEWKTIGERSEAIQTNADLFPLACYYYPMYITVYNCQEYGQKIVRGFSLLIRNMSQSMRRKTKGTSTNCAKSSDVWLNGTEAKSGTWLTKEVRACTF